MRKRSIYLSFVFSPIIVFHAGDFLIIEMETMTGMDLAGVKISFRGIDDPLDMVIRIVGGKRIAGEKSSSRGIDEGEE